MSIAGNVGNEGSTIKCLHRATFYPDIARTAARESRRPKIEVTVVNEEILPETVNSLRFNH